MLCMCGRFMDLIRSLVHTQYKENSRCVYHVIDNHSMTNSKLSLAINIAIFLGS